MLDNMGSGGGGGCDRGGDDNTMVGEVHTDAVGSRNVGVGADVNRHRSG